MHFRRNAVHDALLQLFYYKSIMGFLREILKLFLESYLDCLQNTCTVKSSLTLYRFKLSYLMTFWQMRRFSASRPLYTKNFSLHYQIWSRQAHPQVLIGS